MNEIEENKKTTEKRTLHFQSIMLISATSYFTVTAFVKD